MELFVTLFQLKWKTGQSLAYGMIFTEKKVWTVNVKDIEWLTVELAGDSEEIYDIHSELDQLKQKSNINENSSHEQIVKLEQLLELNRNNSSLKSHRNNTKSWS